MQPKRYYLFQNPTQGGVWPHLVDPNCYGFSGGACTKRVFFERLDHFLNMSFEWFLWGLWSLQGVRGTLGTLEPGPRPGKAWNGLRRHSHSKLRPNCGPTVGSEKSPTRYNRSSSPECNRPRSSEVKPRSSEKWL